VKYRNDTKVITKDGKTYWVNAKTSGLYSDLLKPMFAQLEAMLSHYTKVHVLRFDLRQYDHTPTNKRMSVFNRRYIKWLKHHYGFKRVGFIWVREQETADQQHYHYALLVDGQKVRYPAKLYERADKIWSDMDGSAHLPKDAYYNVTRGNHEEFQEAIYRLSYLAKTRSKGKRPPQTKDIGTSRIKKL
jgi:hypothetical protein